MNSNTLSQFSVNTFPGRFLLFLAISAFLCQTVFSGVIDTSFGTGGRFTIGFAINTGGAPEPTSGGDIFMQPNGRIVALGSHTGPGFPYVTASIAMVGLTPDGILDNSFGTGGKVLLYDPQGFSSYSLVDSEMLPNGKFLLLSNFSAVKVGTYAGLSRRNENGSPDPSFSANLRVSVSGSNTALRMAVLPDGKIYVLVSGSAIYLVRLNSDGSRDSSFGIEGAKLVDFSRASGAYIADMQATPEGKVVIALYNGTMMRLDSYGELDRSFGLQGVVKIYLGNGLSVRQAKLLVQPDEKIILFGGIGNPIDTALFRFTRRGKLDGSFGNAGMVVSDFIIGGNDYASDCVLLNDGSIVISGQARPPLQSDPNFMLAKYAGDGTLAGVTVTPFLTTAGSRANWRSSAA
jgi:uncharacterized delta-60 repeat protein